MLQFVANSVAAGCLRRKARPSVEFDLEVQKDSMGGGGVGVAGKGWRGGQGVGGSLKGFPGFWASFFQAA